MQNWSRKSNWSFTRHCQLSVDSRLVFFTVFSSTCLSGFSNYFPSDLFINISHASTSSYLTHFSPFSFFLFAFRTLCPARPWLARVQPWLHCPWAVWLGFRRTNWTLSRDCFWIWHLHTRLDKGNCANGLQYLDAYYYSQVNLLTILESLLQSIKKSLASKVFSLGFVSLFKEMILEIQPLLQFIRKNDFSPSFFNRK